MTFRIPLVETREYLRKVCPENNEQLQVSLGSIMFIMGKTLRYVT